MVGLCDTSFSNKKTERDNQMKKEQTCMDIQKSLRFAEQLQTYLSTWLSAEENKETEYLIEMALDTTNNIIDSMNSVTWGQKN